MSTMPAIGLPAGAPERPVTQAAYPAVHDLPPARSGALLNDVEQQRMEDELVAARVRQGGPAVLPPAAAKRAAPRSRATPVSSTGTIY